MPHGKGEMRTTCKCCAQVCEECMPDENAHAELDYRDHRLQLTPECPPGRLTPEEGAVLSGTQDRWITPRQCVECKHYFSKVTPLACLLTGKAGHEFDEYVRGGLLCEACEAESYNTRLQDARGVTLGNSIDTSTFVVQDQCVFWRTILEANKKMAPKEMLNLLHRVILIRAVSLGIFIHRSLQHRPIACIAAHRESDGEKPLACECCVLAARRTEIQEEQIGLAERVRICMWHPEKYSCGHRNLCLACCHHS